MTRKIVVALGLVLVFQALFALGIFPGRSTSLPLIKVGPARATATRWGH
jgi:hypothetical protein